jgi:hypothetical protein
VSTDDDSGDELVFEDAGGWISGPSLDVERLDDKRLGGPRVGIKVGAWMRA